MNAANFFQAEMVGVVLPVLSTFLRESNWRYDAIGVATAAGALGSLLFQTPAGLITDRVSCRRRLFAMAALLTGVCFAIIPLVPHSYQYIVPPLFLAGAAGAFFAPVLAALALALVGHARLSRTIGTNQGWNHAGNIAAAVSAIAVVSRFGINSIFYAVGLSSLCAACSALLIRENDLDERLATGLTRNDQHAMQWSTLLRDRTILAAFVSVFLFHLANAPILPAVGLYVKQLGGSDRMMTATVLTAQCVMVPVALLSGSLCDLWGRKPVLAIAFWALPLRILSYSFAQTPAAIVWLQTLDGIGAGIYGVAIVALAADLTRGKGWFNTLTGLFATAVAIGGFAGPLITGVLLQHLGFKSTFYCFAGLALLGAGFFTILVPETAASSRKDLQELPETA